MDIPRGTGISWYMLQHRGITRIKEIAGTDEPTAEIWCPQYIYIYRAFAFRLCRSRNSREKFRIIPCKNFTFDKDVDISCFSDIKLVPCAGLVEVMEDTFCVYTIIFVRAIASLFYAISSIHYIIYYLDEKYSYLHWKSSQISELK